MVDSVIGLFAASRSNIATGSFDWHAQSVGRPPRCHSISAGSIEKVLTAGAGGQPSGANAASLTSQVVKNPDQKNCKSNKESYEAGYGII